MSAVLLSATCAVKPTDLDGRLLALADELYAVKAKIDANCAVAYAANGIGDVAREEEADAELDDLQLKEFWPISDEIAKTPAHTPAGVQAKARVLRIVFLEAGSIDDHDPICRHMLGLVRDIAGEG